ncbi:MAG: hypothetical protein JNJ77_20850 [Planctomycetia bacterium]|nr:hypothetical protein [Planctomycetia bacterium]
MPDALFSLDGWLLRTTLAGGIVLFIGSVWMLLTRQPVQRQRIGESALLAALLVALPAALPAWWSLPGTEAASPTNRALFNGNLSDHLNVQPAKPEKKESAFANSLELAEQDAELFEIVGLLQSLKNDDGSDASHQDGGVIYQETPPAEAETAKCKVKGLSFSMQFWTWTLRGIGVTYLTMVLVLLIRCSIGYYGLWRYWRHRRPAPAHVHTALAELEPDPALRPRIGVNSLVHGPVSYGLWKPTILLPPHFCNEGDPEKLRWILAHELTHLRRRDAWGCLLLALGGAFYFHVPWYWWMKRHVRLAQEYLADAAAVKFSSAVEYAQYLVSLTSCSSRPTLASSQATGVFETPSDLYRRVHMLLHQRSVLERGTPRWWTVTAAASFLALATCTAGMKLQAVEPDVHVANTTQADDDEQKVDKKSSDVKKERKVKVIVDGKEVSGDEKNVIVLQGDDKGDGKLALRMQIAGLDDKQKKIDEALKKLDQALEKMPKQLDAETKARLEEVKKTLKSMKENQQVWLKAADEAKGEAAKLHLRLHDLHQDHAALTEDAKKHIELHLQQAQKHAKLQTERAAQAEKLASDHRDKALAAEKLAKQAQEKALVRWREARSGDDRDAAIKELEKAIAEKEKALKSLKDNTAKRGDMVARVAPASSKGRLGVMVATIDPTLRSHLDIGDDQGLLIQNVVEDSAAWNNGKGLKNGDILLNLGGKSISSSPEKFVELVKSLKEGTHSATVLRKGKKVNIQGIKLPGAEKISDEDTKPAAALSPLELHLVPVLDGKVDHVTLAPSINKAVQAQMKLDPVVIKDLVTIKPELAQLAHGQLKLEPAVKFNPVLEVKPNMVLEHPITIAGDVKKAQVVDAAVDHDPQGTVTSKPRLGVVLDQVPEVVATQVELAEDRGLLVKEVVEGSAAQKAGFLKNDILIEFADKAVTRDHPAFTERVKSLKPGKYTATVIRKGKEIRLRDINLTAVKSVDEERKAKAKEWMVEDTKEKETAKAESKKKDGFDKNKEDFFPNARPNFNFGRQQGNTSVSINNGKFTATTTNDEKTVTVVGQMVNGKAQPSSITIKTEDSEKKYKTVKDVPEEDRAEVEKLLSSFKGNAFMLRGNEFNAGAFNDAFEQHMKQLEKQMKEMGLDNPGFEQMEKQMQELRKQLQRLRQNRQNNDDDNQN